MSKAGDSLAVCPIVRAGVRFVLGTRLEVLPLDDGMAWLERTGQSLIRWGDGETAIVRGKSIPFQTANAALAEILHQLLRQARRDIAIGLPAAALTGSVWGQRRHVAWLPTRWLWSQHVRTDRTYLDAFMFRDRPIEALAALKATASRRSWLVVASSQFEDGHYFTDVGRPATWIGVPSRDAFGDRLRLVDEIRAAAGALTRATGEADGLILIAAGPTAKVLVADLAETWRCYDVGHLFHFQRHPAKINVWSR